MVLPFNFTVTPLNTGTGLFPIRDMTNSLFQYPIRSKRACGLNLLPNLTQNFAANLLLASFAITHHTAAGAQDAYSESVKHGAKVFRS